MNDLTAMLAGFENTPLWRAAMSDFVSDRWSPDQAPVELHQLPTGFHRRFHVRSLPRLKREPGSPNTPHRSFRSLSKSDICHLLRYDLGRRIGHLDVFDHMGSTEVLGVPVLVGEPYPTTDHPDVVACTLTNLLGFPVSHHPEAAWNDGCIRFCVWFQFDA